MAGGKKITLFFLSVALLVLPVPAHAQVRGPGVGALASTTNGTTGVTITNGRTAPWAEVIVENGSEELQAVAEINASGLFTFSFNTQPGNLGNLVIYAVDEAGVTTTTNVTGVAMGEFILPPTIVGNTTGLPDTSVGMEGFSYPNATVTVTLTSDNGYSNTFTPTANGVTGKWTQRVDSLSPGNYIAHAHATSGVLTSNESQDLTFSIGLVTPTPTGGPIISLPPIGEIISPIASAAGNIATTLKEGTQEIINRLPTRVRKNVDIVSKVLAPVAATTLWGSGLLNLFNILEYINSVGRILLGFFIPMKKKKNRWGIVYDALTKQPIARAIVRLYRANGALVETEATGKNGIFSFLTEPGQYDLKVTHPEYTFPSHLVVGKDDGEYQAVYHGEFITVSRTSPVVNVSVPMDPKGYQVIPAYSGLKVFIGRLSLYSNAILYITGLALSFIAYFINPVLYNLIVIIFYLISLAYLLSKIYDERTKWGTVRDIYGKPAPGVSLSLLDSVFRRLVQRRVTDQYGRFQFVVPPGGYVILISSPEWELAPILKGYDGSSIEIKKEINVVKPRIYVRRKPERSNMYPIVGA